MAQRGSDAHETTEPQRFNEREYRQALYLRTWGLQTCPRCETEFAPYRRDQRYCGRKCAAQMRAVGLPVPGRIQVKYRAAQRARCRQCREYHEVLQHGLCPSCAPVAAKTEVLKYMMTLSEAAAVLGITVSQMHNAWTEGRLGWLDRDAQGRILVTESVVADFALQIKEADQ